MQQGRVVCAVTSNENTNPDLDRPQERISSRRPSVQISRPTVALMADKLEVSKAQLLGDLFVLIISPPILWGLYICAFPFSSEHPGIAWQNISAMFFLGANGAPTTLVFKTVFQLYYSGMTYGLWLLSSSMFLCYVLLFSFVIMALGIFPLPANALWLSTGWFPAHILTIYLGLKRKGTLSVSRGARRVFFRLSLIFLPIFVYFPVCGTFYVGMVSFNGEPLKQAVVSCGYSLVSRLMKRKSMDVVSKLLPRHMYRPTGSWRSSRLSSSVPSNITQHEPAFIEEDSRGSKVRLGIFFQFEFCQELIMIMAFSSVSDYSSALFMMFIEVAPFLVLPLRLTSRYYKAKQVVHKWSRQLVSLEDYRLMVVELFTLHLLAEICAIWGFLVLTPLLKYGWNSEYFPLRESCDDEYFTSVGFVISSGTLVMLVGVLDSVWIWKKYGIHTGRVMAAQLRMNRDILWGFAMLVCGYPCALLFRQANLMYMVEPDAYADAPPGKCS